MRGSSLIFIPDITGFTSFVEKTEISHSEHIISELIELIIEANSIGLEVSEIEGDAVLFYKENNLPDLTELMSQIESMFKEFHTHLKKYEKYRICTCGACSTASELSLKFIVHVGELGFINVQGSKKPHGKTLVVAHKLLKNEVKYGSYALLSDAAVVHFTQAEEWEKGKVSYSETGTLSYNFKSLEKLLEEIPEPPEPSPPDRIEKPIKVEALIKSDLDSLSKYVIDFSEREKWQAGILGLKYNQKEINRIGTNHVCIVNNRELDFETVSVELSDEKRAYGEKNFNPPLFRSAFSYYTLVPENDHIRVTFEFHYFQKNILSRLLTPFIGKMIKQGMLNSMNNLKKLAESQ